MRPLVDPLNHLMALWHTLMSLEDSQSDWPLFNTSENDGRILLLGIALSNKMHMVSHHSLSGTEAVTLRPHNLKHKHTYRLVKELDHALSHCSVQGQRHTLFNATISIAAPFQICPYSVQASYVAHHISPTWSTPDV